MICLKCKANVLIPGFKPFNSFCFLYDKTPWKPEATEPSRKWLFLPLHLSPLLIPHLTSTYLPFSEDVFPLHASKRSQVLLPLYRISFFIHSPSSCPFKLLCILHFSAWIELPLKEVSQLVRNHLPKGNSWMITVSSDQLTKFNKKFKLFRKFTTILSWMEWILHFWRFLWSYS